MLLHVVGELDLSAERAVVSHLQKCAECRDRAEALRRDTARIEVALRTDLQAPSGLLDGVRSAIEAQPKQPTLWRWAPAFAVAAIALAWAMSHPQPVSAQAPMPLAEVAQRSELLTPMPESTPERLARTVGIPIAMPNLSGAGAEMAGCGQCPLAGTPVAVVRYRWKGQLVALCQMPTSKLAFEPGNKVSMAGMDFFCCSRKGVSVVAWSKGPAAYVLMARTDQMSLMTLARVALSAI